MKTRQLLMRASGHGQAVYDATKGCVAGDCSSSDAAAALAAARARLAASTRESQRRKTLSNEVYYPDKANIEETIYTTSCIRSLNAMVTRNHYGSLILNAAGALFIDVDAPQPRYPTRPANAFGDRGRGPWQRMLDDLRTVLMSEEDKGFRIYRTAAGFRILATTHEFEPGSQPAKRLMTSVGADYAFVQLCRIQKTFRARLTPKPWRCGTAPPPNQFPRHLAGERRRFAEWLAQYKRACRDRATCHFLEHVGTDHTHERVAPIIKYHDRETKALQALELA